MTTSSGCARSTNRGVSLATIVLSPKTIHNFYISLSSFFTWACREFNLANPIKAVPKPKFEEAPFEPFTKEQVEALLKAWVMAKEADTTLRRKYTMRRSNAYRDRAVIMLLVDTGVRASELSALKIGDVDLKTGKVNVKHSPAGGAKGDTSCTATPKLRCLFPIKSSV